MTQSDYIVIRIIKKCEISGINKVREKYISFFKNKNFNEIKDKVDKNLIKSGYEHLIDKTI